MYIINTRGNGVYLRGDRCEKSDDTTTANKRLLKCPVVGRAWTDQHTGRRGRGGSDVTASSSPSFLVYFFPRKIKED